DVRSWHYDWNLAKFVMLAQFNPEEPARFMLVDPVTGQQEIMLTGMMEELGSPKISPSGSKVLWGAGVQYVRDIATGNDEIVACPGYGLAWASLPEAPVLAGESGVFVCADDGSERLLYEDVMSVLGANEQPSYSSGANIIFWTQPVSGVSSVWTYDGDTLEQIGRIPYELSRLPFVEGVLEDGSVWFTFRDEDNGYSGIGLNRERENFSFPGVRVGVGLNEFNVLARDRFGNVSDLSGEIFINAAPEKFKNVGVSLTSVQTVAIGMTIPVNLVV